MKTKEAIELTKSFRNDLNNKYFKNEIDYFDSITDLLKRGEKYEEMWKELYSKYSDKELSYILDELERKYFPKPKDKCDNCNYKRLVKEFIINMGDKEL